MTKLSELERAATSRYEIEKRLLTPIMMLCLASMMGKQGQEGDIAECKKLLIDQVESLLLTSLRERDALLREAMESLMSGYDEGYCYMGLIDRIRAALTATGEAGEKKEMR